MQLEGGLPSAAVVLLVGAPRVGKRSLARRLVQHGKPALRDVDSDGDTTSLRSSETPEHWHIDTKYYTADVRIRVASLSDPSGVSVTPECEAVVLVVDVGDASSWAAVREWAQTADLEGAGIRLCIANKADQLHSCSWVEEMQDWCLENMFEPIKVCCIDAELDAGLEWEGDAQGVRRVVQALEAHSWPGLRMKSSLGSNAAIPAGHATSHEVSEVVVGELESGQRQPDAGDLIGDFFGDSALFDDEDEEGMEGMGLRELEIMMARVAQQRGQLAQLPDEQRREQAGRLAMQLMQVMGLGDEEEQET